MKVLIHSGRTEVHLIKNAYQDVKTDCKDKQTAETRCVLRLKNKVQKQMIKMVVQFTVSAQHDERDIL